MLIQNNIYCWISSIVNWGFWDFLFKKQKEKLKHLKDLKPECFFKKEKHLMVYF